MDRQTTEETASALERLADQEEWQPDVWNRCFQLIKGNSDNDLLAYVYDDVIHYDGAFHSHNLFGVRVKPDLHELENYRQEFRNIAAALRSSMSLAEAKKKYGL